MKRIAALLLLLSTFAVAQSLSTLEMKRVTLPNGWSLTPVGKSLNLGDLPLNIAVSASKKYVAVTNNGQSGHMLQLIDAKSGTMLDSFKVGKAWLGLAFSSDDKWLYASGGNDNWILKLAVAKNKLVPADTIVLGKPWPNKISVAGIALDERRNRIYTVTKENNSFYSIDLATKSVLQQLPLGGEGYTCLLSPNGKELYISCWGCDTVRIYDTEKQQLSGAVAVGDNPNDMCVTKNGKFLFVANANDNSVSVIDLMKRKVIETLNTALYPDSPSGSTANSVALSDDGENLYIANADNNCLSVFDVEHPGTSMSKGFIPTGWYPSCVRVVKKDLYVANGKGFSSMANPYGPNPANKNQRVSFQHGDSAKPIAVQYIAGILKGTMSIIPQPDHKTLGIYSQVVYKNTPFHKDQKEMAKGEAGNPIPRKIGEPSLIKHVFYIIKENRTYDQVLGDVKEGNGDTSLVLFGENVTPNQHALVKEFVLLDNFYVDGEVSADGHNWSMGAYATDYLEKTWPTSYGGRGGEYDAEGTRNVANNKEFIWNVCAKKGVTYRTYGEFADDYKPNLPVIAGHFCPTYTSWDQNVRDTTRFSQWKHEFDSLLAKNAVPQFNTLRFINDHTEGLRKGRPTPFANVADNDLAVGLFVEYLSKSPIWNESVVFILEDDAQNGPDHVDAHRSPCYIAGGLVKRNFVDHTPYSTSSVLRTMELILGLPPMSQYDAAATPMWRCFQNTPNGATFTVRPSNIDLDAVNIAMNEWQRKSEEFDFTMEDRAPDRELNEVLWVAVRGEHVPFPPVKRAAFFGSTDKD